jgi:MarR family 2-MHQ and catechol resistance regulon transcriptional repressor
LTPQQLRAKTLPSTEAFSSLLGAYAALNRELSAALLARHGLTINDYGALLLLSRADDQGMRRIDLANQLQLSPSGVTRLLDRLEDQGLVGKGECKEDARVSYAVLTEPGLEKLREAAPDHIADIDRRLSAILSEEEIRKLDELLSRLSDSHDSCDPTP